MDPVRSAFERLLRNIPVYFKMGALFVLILLLLIPIAMVEGLVDERQYRLSDTIREISESWGREQVLFGPVLVVPFRASEEVEDSDGNRSLRTRSYIAHFLPETLAIDAEAAPEVRYRGVYEAVVYSGEVGLSGRFAAPDFGALDDLVRLDITEYEVLWDKATLALGVSDLRGTRGQVSVDFAGTTVPFSPGAATELIRSGIGAPVGAALPAGWQESGPLDFKFALNLKGSSAIGFIPAGNETTVTLRSSWPHPGFDGAWLPAERTVGAEGFEARWEISWFGRGFPQQWATQNFSHMRDTIAGTRFGASLVTPVGFYQKSERSVKYGILFVLLVFATIFILEVAVPLRVHLVQYMLVGFALAVFYLILLALAELIGFALAYGAAALVATAMIALYLKRALGSARNAAPVAGVVAAVYAFLYVVLQLEEYALITGTAGIVIALAAVMYATRGIDWYALAGSADTDGSGPSGKAG